MNKGSVRSIQEEVVLKFQEKQITIKIFIDTSDSIEQVKKKIGSIFDVDLNKIFDICIRHFPIAVVFNKMLLIDYLDDFNAREIQIVRKLNHAVIENDVENFPNKNVDKLQDELHSTKQLNIKLNKEIAELKTTFEELKNEEHNLKKLSNSPDKKNLSNLTGTSFSYSYDTEVSFNSKERLFSKFIDEFNSVQFKKENDLKVKVDKLIFYKQLEKLSFKICKSNETSAIQLVNIEKDKETRRKVIEKLKEKEERVIDKLSKDCTLIYKYMKDKKKMDNNYYFQKIKMQFSREFRSKINMKLIDEKSLLIFQINYKKPKESDLLYRAFKDKCDFYSFFKEKVHTRLELQLNHKKRLFIIIKKDSFVYDFKTNEMSSLSFFPLQDSHENGNLVYMPYDNSLYCISGLKSSIIEKLKLPSSKEKMHDLKETWSTVCSLSMTRAGSCSFVLNKKILYIVLGYDYLNKKHCTDVQKLDVSVQLPILVSITLKEMNSPKLTMASCLKFMDSSVYILGGMYSEREKNPNVFIFDTTGNTFHKTEFMISQNNEVYDVNKKVTSKVSANFIYESAFIPVKFESTYEENAFFYCLFDSSCFLHMINVKTFKHFMMCQNNKEEIWDEESDEEGSRKGSNSEKLSISKDKTNNDRNSLEAEFEVDNVNFKKNPNISSIENRNKNYSSSSEDNNIIMMNNEKQIEEGKTIYEDEVIDSLSSECVVEHEGLFNKGVHR